MLPRGRWPGHIDGRKPLGSQRAGVRGPSPARRRVRRASLGGLLPPFHSPRLRGCDEKHQPPRALPALAAAASPGD